MVQSVLAENLAGSPDSEVVLAVRNLQRGNHAASRIGANVLARQIDMSSPQSIERFMTDWQKPVAGLVNNAGVQIVDATRRTEGEGFEETFLAKGFFLWSPLM